MRELNIGEKVVDKKLVVFEVIEKHDKFSDYVDKEEPLMLVYDGNINQERYISWAEYKNMKYDVIKNISIITKGWFKTKVYLTEDKPRYDIKNTETGEIVKQCYLHNGFWITVSDKIIKS